MNHRRRFLAHVGIAGLTGMGGILAAERSAPALISASSRFRRFDEPDKEPTLEELKTQLAAASTERDRIKADHEKLSGDHQTATKRLKEIDDASLSEADKTKKAAKDAEDRATAAETRAKDSSVRLQIERDARKLNIVDEDAAYKLLDRSKIEFDADGEPTNIAALMEALVKDRPFLLAADGTSTARTGNSTNANRPRQNPTGTFTESQIADRAFYLANEAAIMKAMSEGRIVKG